MQGLHFGSAQQNLRVVSRAPRVFRLKRNCAHIMQFALDLEMAILDAHRNALERATSPRKYIRVEYACEVSSRDVDFRIPDAQPKRFFIIENREFRLLVGQQFSEIG